MIFRAAALSDVGLRRRSNEDSFLVAPKLGLYLVADGMGGHKAGQVASELAVEYALGAVGRTHGSVASMTDRLAALVSAANREIFARARSRPELRGMGTTLVAALTGEGCVALAHVGDSRAYLIRGQGIRQLTHDHSVVGDLVRRSEITEQDARSHPHRHVLTRALGVRSDVEADFAELSTCVGDTFVLCSDGLTGRVRDHEIGQIVLSAPSLDDACQRLIQTANERGGEDNITVVIVRPDLSK
ncbi:MAG: Stp1/IreP family PP2C-type Ser/Thr phosphatase [Myxococcota bacterium]